MSPSNNKRKFIVLINPISGTKKKDIIVAYVEKILAAENLTYQIQATVANGNYKILQEKIVAEKITDIIILGGDGTVNTVMQTLRFNKINVGIIPCGSGNGLAFAAGIPKDYKIALQIILEKKPVFVDAFMCNQQFACMLCGIGFDAQVAHDFAKQKKRGLATYAKQSFQNFIKAKPYPFTITINEETVDTDAFFISVANSNQFGNHFTIAPKASLCDGLLDIVIVQKMSKLRLPFAILKQLSGRNKYASLSQILANNPIVYLQTDKIKIENTKSAPLHIDGEAVNTYANFDFEIIRNCFKLYCGNR